ncbi:hypothetical protein CEUSTIGMA_g11601.t1 [Chlamydomonas eustigma]|uniref:Vitamin B6 photo-protection and homoeostasis-domain-containing protein n=1 Tax=Chlamydomonas eustigma TaxID=1157962 RepID=A0A250XM83_9CHLO|nr:hypothetical protein CEUSTIGMA_g11601.t1 [Chlamydomonas eustigma]|eukprot:GAX84178.1 hypothetical protein CEUSTIGMA_g11601.t1 [Chlamydomonas eustigma]
MLALTALCAHKSRPLFYLKRLPYIACTRNCAKQSVVADKAKVDGDVHLQGRMSQDIGSHGLQITLHLTNAASKTTMSSIASSKEHQQDFDGSFYSTRANNVVALWYRWTKGLVMSTFLPAGYPHTCGSNYLQFTLWAGVTNFAVTANAVLASTFLLYSVGLGAGAIPAAGALNWVLKDGIGQLGTLVFGKVIAHNFDIHSKSWYFLSMLQLKVATALEMLTILCPEYFLAMGSAANGIKGLALMASGSTRSVFNLSFALDNNIADITAKSTSQWIFSSLLGTAAGVGMCSWVGQNGPLAVLCYSSLTAVTLLSAYQTVRSIPLATLNSTRLQLLTDMFLSIVRDAAESKAARLRSAVSASNGADGWIVGLTVKAGWDEGGYVAEDASTMEYDRSFDEEMANKIPSPVQLAAEDPPFPVFFSDDRIMNPRIFVGTPVKNMIEGNPEHLVVLLATFKFSRYMVFPSTGAVHVILHQTAENRDIYQAYLQACLLRRRIKHDRCKYLHGGEHSLTELRIALQDTLLAAERLTTPFMSALTERGWRTDKVVVEAVRRRARWSALS